MSLIEQVLHESDTLSEITLGTSTFIVSEVSTTSVASISSSTAIVIANENPESSSLLGYLLWQLSSLSMKLLGFSLITIPSWIFSLLSTNINITLSFSSLIIILGLFACAIFSVIRYRVLTSYSRSVDERRQKPRVDAFIGSRDQDNKRRLGSYLDEFLTAIKIFGYLEKPVFNELTRSMKTQKLYTDEILYVDEKLGFAIVVEGNVQIFTRVKFQPNGYSDEDATNELDSEILTLNNERYQLLNEIKTGNPLSSLVNILSLFTDENIASTYDANPIVKQKLHNGEFARASAHDIYADPLDDNLAQERFYLKDNASSSSFQDSQTPEFIARASIDSTIAMIPAESFRILKKKHPRSSSHIVQMILTRLYRVTLQTANNYLGLTREIFETEIKLNSKAKLEIPSYLHDGVKEKFRRGLFDPQHSSPVKNINSNSPRGRDIQQNSTNARSESLVKLSPGFRSESRNNPRPNMRRNESRHVVLNSRGSSNPGDLLSNVPLSRKELSYQALIEDDVVNRSFSAEEETEETSLKTAIAEAMFNFLGIDRENINPRRESSTTPIINSPITGPTSTTTEILPMLQFEPLHANANSHIYSHIANTKTLSTTSSSKLSYLENSRSPSNVDIENAKSDFANEIEILRIDEGTIIIDQNSRDNGLYYVISGVVEVTYSDPASNREHILYSVQPGGVAGYLGSLVGYKSFVTLKAKTELFVGYLSKKKLERLCDSYFMIYLSIARSLIKSLSRKILRLDSALEWIQLDAGETLFKQDTTANGIYIVLNGRLRSLYENPKTKEIGVFAEYGQGESFGEVEVLTAARRSSTFVAVRDSETARIPRTLFEILALENPSIMIKVSRIVAKTIKAEAGEGYQDIYRIPSVTKFKHSVNKNYRTITILPTAHGLPVAEFANKLVQAFKNVNRSVIGLDQASTLNFLGKHAFDRLSRLRQSGFFSDLEERYQIVVYIADTALNSSWTNTCIQQGDCILLLADALSDPSIGDYERLLLKAKTTPRTELILLHSERYVEPGLTTKWLKNRVWAHSHHHIQFSCKTAKSTQATAGLHLNAIAQNLRTKVENFRTKYVDRKRAFVSTEFPHKNDFLRLARLLSGQAVGVVLGGGGARGFSHLGVLKALQENGIPIDIIGGTSIGSFVGGLYARDYDLVPLYGRAKKFAGRLSSVWRTIMDLTIPTTSYTTGHEFNRGLWKAFGDIRIEDFWIQFYCNSTNITNSCMEIHSEGFAWRFIRASMSLAGLLPPIADNGSMLLDGGYVDNLPVDEMKNRGASIIFAVDVGSVDDRTPMEYGDSLSGLWILFNSWNPFSKHPNIPTMSEIQMRLCYVASVNALERAKATPGLIYLRPPVENYATLDFAKFEEIFNVGSVYGHLALKELEGKLPIAGASTSAEKRTRSIQRRNSI